jgi:hypothetical protein
MLEKTKIYYKLMGLDIALTGTAHGTMLTEITGTNLAKQLLWK